MPPKVTKKEKETGVCAVAELPVAETPPVEVKTKPEIETPPVAETTTQPEQGIKLLFNRIENGKLSSTAVEIGFLPGVKDTFDEGVRSVKSILQGTLSSSTTGGLLDMEEAKATIMESLRFWPHTSSNDHLRTETWKRPAEIDKVDFPMLCRVDPALREVSRMLMDLNYTIVRPLDLEYRQLDSLWTECTGHLAQFIRDKVAYIKVNFMPMDDERLFPQPNRGAELIAQTLEDFYGDKTKEKQKALSFLWRSGINYTVKMGSEVRGKFLKIVGEKKAEWVDATPQRVVAWMTATLFGEVGYSYANAEEEEK